MRKVTKKKRKYNHIRMIETINEIENMDSFKKILEINPGLVIIKFGADWCGPCKKIEGMVMDWFSKMPNNVQTVYVDIDESFEVYAFLKNKKMLNGIPGILMYKKGNIGYIFDDAVNNSNCKEIDDFFSRCLKQC